MSLSWQPVRLGASLPKGIPDCWSGSALSWRRQIIILPTVCVRRIQEFSFIATDHATFALTRSRSLAISLSLQDGYQGITLHRAQSRPHAPDRPESLETTSEPIYPCRRYSQRRGERAALVGPFIALDDTGPACYPVPAGNCGLFYPWCDSCYRQPSMGIDGRDLFRSHRDVNRGSLLSDLRKRKFVFALLVIGLGIMIFYGLGNIYHLQVNYESAGQLASFLKYQYS